MLVLVLVLTAVAGPRAEEEERPASPRPRVLVELSRDGEVTTSRATLFGAGGGRLLVFPVGFGRDGWLEAGSRFRDGCSLLGRFEINAVLAPGRFEMKRELVERSGKGEGYLREHLFRNMNGIDFDGDGEGGEYGGGFLGLEPLPLPLPAGGGGDGGAGEEVDQPFAFGVYRGVFRWYSFAIHGTRDEARVGRASTGGCINVGREALQVLLATLRVGDRVEIVAAGGRAAADAR